MVESNSDNNQSTISAVSEKPVAKKKITVQIVPFEDKYAAGVIALYGEVFGQEAARAYERRWHWSLRENLVPDESPAWVLAAGNEVVGYLGTVPHRYVIDGTEIIAHATADYMVHEKYRFYGVSLMKRFFKECENCITADDMEATVKVTTWLGAKEAGILQRHVKVLDARALTDKPKLKRIPRFPLWPFTVGIRIVDRFRSANKPIGVKIERCDQFDDRFVSLNTKLAGPQQAIVKRDGDFLNWRYGPTSPHSNRQIVTATLENGEFAGYAVYSSGGTTGRNGYLLDLQVAPGSDRGIAEALLKAVINDMRKVGLWSCRYHGVTPQDTQKSPQMQSPVLEALKSWGFTPRTGHWLLVKLQDERLMEVAMKEDNWNFRYGDSEASHSAL